MKNYFGKQMFFFLLLLFVGIGMKSSEFMCLDYVLWDWSSRRWHLSDFAHSIHTAFENNYGKTTDLDFFEFLVDADDVNIVLKVDTTKGSINEHQIFSGDWVL